MNAREQLETIVKIGLRFRKTPIVDDDFPAMRDEFDRTLDRAATHLLKPRPKIVCLCGSTRFKEAFVKAMREETLAGNIVLTVGMFGHQEGIDMNGPVKAMLDELHKRKIDEANEVLILNCNGYIGSSTRSELEYAQRHHKTIRFLEPDAQCGHVIQGTDRNGVPYKHVCNLRVTHDDGGHTDGKNNWGM